MDNLSMDVLKKKAAKVFLSHSVDECFATTDGMIFLKKNQADNHCVNKGLKTVTFKRKDTLTKGVEQELNDEEAAAAAEAEVKEAEEKAAAEQAEAEAAAAEAEKQKADADAAEAEAEKQKADADAAEAEADAIKEAAGTGALSGNKNPNKGIKSANYGKKVK